jgi:hypothetical protein
MFFALTKDAPGLGESEILTILKFLESAQSLPLSDHSG